MLLCLSSGATRRYRHDILRSVAMPLGAYLQFRYRVQYVSDRLKQAIVAENVERDVCIAYIDKSSNPPVLIPCRAAKLVKARIVGDFCTFILELKEFFIARDIRGFNREVRAAAGNLPSWRGSELEGVFCERLSNVPSALLKSQEVEDWQAICKSLAEQGQFRDEPYFYFVQGVFPLSGSTPVPFIDGKCALEENTCYDVSIVHYSPLGFSDSDKVKDIDWLLVEGGGAQLSFLSTQSIAVDSDYDNKFVRFCGESTVQPTNTLMSFFRHVNVRAAPNLAEATWDFDIPLEVRPGFRRLVMGAILGLGLALPALATIWFNEEIATPWTMTFWVAVAGVIAGVMANSGLRKP